MNEEDMIIQNTVEYELEEIKDKPLEGLCIYLANNIHYELEKEGITTKIINIKDYTECTYNHVFVIAKNKYNKNIYLIDPSYVQFIPRHGQKLIAFSKWPASILKETENGKILLNNLTKQGYSLVTKDDIEIYLNSFKQNITKENITICQNKKNRI